MFRNAYIGPAVAGAAAGIVTGLFGGGGGMVLVPLLTALTNLEEQEIFPASITIILPICVASLIVTGMQGVIPWMDALPYLIGSALGGICAGKWRHRIPAKWLHRVLGLMILWGGFRYLW